MYFNISHSGNYVICAFSEEASLGIDIEEIKMVNLLDFKSFYNDADWQKIMISKNTYNAFFDVWTKKEAVVKAMGQGLSISFPDIILTKNRAIVKDSVWFLKNLRIDKQYCVTLASNMQIKKIIRQRLNFD